MVRAEPYFVLGAVSEVLLRPSQVRLVTLQCARDFLFPEKKTETPRAVISLRLQNPELQKLGVQV